MATSAAAALPKDQILPPKEASLFKQILKMFENKQYRGALKSCNHILKKCPDHGETLAMKGLTLSSLDSSTKDEAHQLIKLGLTKCKCKSYVCWHVYGLFYRNNKDYEQAIKCYRNALNIEADNLQILRDLALLQVQCMDTAGLVRTRHRLLELRPTVRTSWLGFALAHHLNRSYQTALKALDSQEAPEHPYEISELKLYRAMILLEAGQYEEVLRFLDQATEHNEVLDLPAALEFRAKALLALGRAEDASKVYVELLKHQPENRNYLLGHVQSLHPNLKAWNDELPDSEREAVVALLQKLADDIPKSHVLQRVFLDVAAGELFEQKLKEFLKPLVRKTVPALCSVLKTLYSSKAKAAAMTRIFSEWEQSLRTHSKFPDEDVLENPSTFLWILVLQAAHYYRIDDYPRALQYITDAIAHTPTVEVLHVFKGRVLKQLGRPAEALEAVEKARLLDTADRFLNGKSVKYHLRNNDIKGAERTAALFAGQPGEDGKPPTTYNVVEMQWMWYELEEGDAFWRMGDILTAMRRWLLIDKHFADIEEDQFDFHTYCLRKSTMRAYVDMLRFERRSHSHRVYLRAAERVVKGYLHIFDAQKRGEDLNAKVVHFTSKEAHPPAAAPENTSADSSAAEAPAAAAAPPKSPERVPSESPVKPRPKSGKDKGAKEKDTKGGKDKDGKGTKDKGKEKEKEKKDPAEEDGEQEEEEEEEEPDTKKKPE
eukprot:RCo033065